MFFEDIRSERLLMRLVADRLSIRWYLGYNLDEPLPDHSSLSRIRTRYGLAVFRHFFDAILQQCRQAKLIWGKEMFFDATQVNANAALDSLTPRVAVEAHLAALFGAEAAEEQAPPQEESLTGVAGSTTVPAALPLALSEALHQELAERNAARHDWIEQAGQQQRNVTHGTYQRMADFLVSTTDPDATAMRLKGGGKHLGYHTHYVVDGGKRRIILNVLVTPAEVMENQPMLDLLWRVQFRWRLRPHQATGDTTYGTLENIKALEDADIRAYVPLPDWSKRTPFFGPEQFRYDAQHDQYVCPNGARLRLKTHRYRYQDKRYLAQAATCNACCDLMTNVATFVSAYCGSACRSGASSQKTSCKINMLGCVASCGRKSSLGSNLWQRVFWTPFRLLFPISVQNFCDDSSATISGGDPNH
jgi:IS5 family transposase